MKRKTKDKLNKLLQSTGDMALKRRARRIIEEIDPQEGDRILEVGCGDGFYLHLLSNLGIKNLELTAIDIDENAINSAKRNLKGKKVILKKADLMDELPFKSGKFDKIIMSEVAEHLSDDIRGVKEVARVLKKSGILVATVPNQNYPFLWDPVNWTLERFFDTHINQGFWAGIWNQHIRLYAPKKIRSVVKKSGFAIKEVSSLTFWCLPFNHNFLHFMARLLYGGELSHNLSSSVSKFEENPNRPFLINLAFGFINSLDKLNDIYTPKNISVGVILVAEK